MIGSYSQHYQEELSGELPARVGRLAPDVLTYVSTELRGHSIVR
jgi:hypothetical protein